MQTETIKPGGLYRHAWDSNLYGVGVGMLPGQWNCRSKDPKSELKFSTEWGENLSINFGRGKLVVVRAKS